MAIYTIKSGILTDDATTPSVARKLARTSNGDLHCVWADQRSGLEETQQIYYAKSTNGGETWQETALTSEESDHHQIGPSIAVDSNDHIHVFWYGRHSGSTTYYQIRYRKYTTSWQAIETLTSGNYHQFDPVSAIDSNDYLHIAWSGWHSGSPGIQQIRYIKYTTSWGSIQNLTSEPTAGFHQVGPVIAIDSDNYIHVAWCGPSETSAYSQIHYIKYTTSWGSIQDLTSTNYNQTEPSVAVDSNDYIHITWIGTFSGSGGYKQTRYIKYTTSWGSIENLTNEAGYPYEVTIAIDGSNYIHIVWSARYSGSQTYYQIRYIKYTTSWGSVQNLTSAGAHQHDPAIIWASSPTLQEAKTNRPKVGYAFIWTDCTSTNSVKFYKSSDLAWDPLIVRLSGTTAISSSVSAPLKVTRELVSTAIDCQSTTSGTLKLDQHLAGTIAVASGTTGSIKVARELAGVSAIESTTTGTLTGLWLFTGTVGAQSVVSGSIRAAWKLNGVVTGESSVTGPLSATRKITGTTVVCECTPSGLIKVVSRLVAIVVSESTVSGSIKISNRLVGTAVIASTVSGPLRRTRSVSRTTTMRSSLTGELTVAELVSVVTIQSTVGGSIKIVKKVTATVTAESTVSGDLTVGMVGTITIQSSVTGLLKPVKKLTSTITVECIVASSLIKVTKKFAPDTIVSQSVVGGSVMVVRKLTTTAPIVSSIAGVLTKTVPMVGVITSQSTAIGTIKVVVEFVGTVAVSSVTVGSIKVSRKLVGTTIVSTCVVTGDLLTEVFYVGTISSLCTVGGAIKIGQKLNTVVTCSCLITGSVKSMKKLTSVPITCISSVQGELAWPVTIPQFCIVSTMNVLPVLVHDCRVNEELRRVSVTHGYTD